MIRSFPERLEQAIEGLSAEELTTRYVPREWTVAQNVHHLVDSHINSYVRMKLIVTEDHPPLKPYDQDVWASMPDASGSNVGVSVMILKGLHTRWADFLSALDEADWGRSGFHPERGDVTIGQLVRIYAEHGDGHIDQIQRTLAAKA